MQIIDWLQLALFLLTLTLITKPLGLYLTQVLDPNGRTWLDPVLRPVEKLTYALIGIRPHQEQNWKQYTLAMLIFSAAACAFTFAILLLQHQLPLNPQNLPALSPALAFNTAISFTTNTNWQSYGGETTLSYFSQMVGLTLHNFTSAATGIAIAAAVVRGIARSTTNTLGNFWVDLVRTTYYLLLPLSLLLAVFLISQGTIQNFKPYDTANLIDPTSEVTTQTIAQGPMASQAAIKMLGTNGGGFTNANASQPFENPTPLANFVQMLTIFAIGSGLTYHLGRVTKNQAHGWAVWIAMMILFTGGVLTCWWAESAGNPIHQQLGIAISDGNMEGKEVRFGIFNSSLFATLTTAASCGAVNAMHDSFTPIGGLVPLLMMELGEVVIGGVGAGLYGMIVFIILAVFIAGLMVGRTPEYLGKKIQAFEIKMAMTALLTLTFTILGFTAWAVVSDWGLAGLNNQGPHGFSEILYAYSSATANNGSAFAGLTATPTNGDPHYNLTLATAMLIGRFLMIIPIMALAGSLAQKSITPPGAGTFPAHGPTFILLLVVSVVLIGALNFLPALALGPIVEHFLMHTNQLF
ncbi:potassium-transporting ATPase subunit KdpA [Phragmitibacter flavus]|uniref:Potassium-transporting ATPase potassium-binding subunit n=1 Tax=Phragmitibacter flavus TaxID=2576071 RepID=A0A5R8KE80_9BACT|nr:potassium-transporting ATPase subunit KdpA [Phragmitibacter flavus]TLD70245.1 potassium-transporting ATPase subunit KdpA [Phragmitibacter flavus]